MSTVDINGLSEFGLYKDTPGYMLPPEAWTEAYNVRYRDGAVERMGGYTQVFGTPGVAPYFAMPLVTSTTNWWLYQGLTKMYAYDGSAHTDITRAAGGNYSGASASTMNGTLLGGVAIMNNGVDIPQFWSPPGTGTDMANLTNWDTNDRCRVMRAFNSYLVAFNLTRSGTNYGHQVLWSHPAEPGTVPSSWDETDSSVDAGLTELPDVNSGVIIDAGMLRGSMYIYKGSSIWRMSFTGGRFIFDFKTFSETAGILAPRCWTMTDDGLQHVVLTQDDLIAHNGNQIRSVLDKKARKYLFNLIDPAAYLETFLFTNPAFGEVWVCYPEQGQTLPTRALIWNYREGGISEADCNWRHAANGEFETVETDTWADGTDVWDTDVGPWGLVNRRQTILVGASQTKFFQADRGLTRDGTGFTSRLQRVGISYLGKTREGQPIVDHEQRKIFRRLWPKVRGGPVNFRIGSSEFVDGSVSWKAVQSFDPASQMTVDRVCSGRAIAMELEETASTHWTLDGYKIEVEKLGRF